MEGNLPIVAEQKWGYTAYGTSGRLNVATEYGTELILIRSEGPFLCLYVMVHKISFTFGDGKT